MDLVAALTIDFTKRGNNQIARKPPLISLLTQANFIEFTQCGAAHHQVRKLIEGDDRPLQIKLQAQACVLACNQCHCKDPPSPLRRDGLIGVLQLRGRNPVVSGNFRCIQAEVGKEIQQPNPIACIGVDCAPLSF